MDQIGMILVGSICKNQDKFISMMSKTSRIMRIMIKGMRIC